MKNKFLNITGNSEVAVIGKLFVQNTENYKFKSADVDAKKIKN